MMKNRHSAWSTPWLPMAVGVHFKLRPPTAAQRLRVSSLTVEVMAASYSDADEIAALSRLGNGRPIDPHIRVAGEAANISACLLLRECFEDVRGLSEPERRALQRHDPAAIRRVVIEGGGSHDPILVPLLAWSETDVDLIRSHREELAHLRRVAEGGEASPPTSETLRQCWDIVTADDGLWVDVNGRPNLDIRNALLAYDDVTAAEATTPPFGLAYQAFAAIHAGRSGGTDV